MNYHNCKLESQIVFQVREESEENVRRECEAVEQVKRSVQAAEQARMEKHELEFEIDQLKIQVSWLGFETGKKHQNCSQHFRQSTGTDL